MTPMPINSPPGRYLAASGCATSAAVGPSPSSNLKQPDRALNDQTDGSLTDRTAPRINSDGSADTTAVVVARLRAVEQMDYAGLVREWRRLYRAHPPKRVGRDLLMLGVAWKIQEQVYGGLRTATKRRLADLANTMERDGDVTRDRVARLKPGTKLLREWRGQTHKIIVLEDGFEWKGSRWQSLSVIARNITGGHWSGPRFFGLNASKRKQTATKVEEKRNA